MDVSIQYLEGTPARADITATEARGRLRSAFERLNFAMVMIGWDLQPAVIEACAEECSRHKAEIYLWQPILTGHGAFRPDPNWRVTTLYAGPTERRDEPIEFGFMCPNQPEVRESAVRLLSAALAGGCFSGVFLDRIRMPSPSLGMERSLGCFCRSCRAAAAAAGFDLQSAREDLVNRLASREGRRKVAAALLGSKPREGEDAGELLQELLDFRAASISAFVHAISAAVKERGLKVGMDCFAPTLTRMVGQDLAALTQDADWIKVMTYARAFGRASLPFELLGLVDWLVAGGESEQSALEALAAATGWPLPGSRAAIRRGGLPRSIVTEELCRGRAMGVRRLLAGIELLEIPDVAKLDRRQIRRDAQAVRAGEPDGVVLSWDLWHMPEWRLELAASLYGEK